MLRPEDPWFLDLDEDAEDPSALLAVLPDIRPYLEPTPAEEDLGLRSLLEHPDCFAHPWWRDQAKRSARTSVTSPRPRAA
jgi:hypothetical protein